MCLLLTKIAENTTLSMFMLLSAKLSPAAHSLTLSSSCGVSQGPLSDICEEIISMIIMKIPKAIGVEQTARLGLRIMDNDWF